MVEPAAVADATPIVDSMEESHAGTHLPFSPHLMRRGAGGGSVSEG